MQGMSMTVESIALFLKLLEYLEHFHLLTFRMLEGFLTSFLGQLSFSFVFVQSRIEGI